MIENYAGIVKRLSGARRTMSVAAAADREVVEAVARAAEVAGIDAVLYGDAGRIEAIRDETGLGGGFRVVDVPDDVAATRAAVRCVHDGEAQVLMKGLVNTSDFMRAVLDKEIGLRTGRVLSHLAAFELPGWSRLLFVTDGGINIAPSLQEKKEILHNALLSLACLGYAKPKVAVLTANEQVNPKAPATVDAAEVAAAWQRGEFGDACIVEGPIALDVALSAEAARHKGIESRIAGETDLFLTPTIEVGNVLGKSMSQLAGAAMAGVVLGASAPIVLTSRAETAESKLNSILLASGCA